VSTDTDSGILKRFLELGGWAAEKLIEFGQEKSGKSKEISRVDKILDNKIL